MLLFISYRAGRPGSLDRDRGSPKGGRLRWLTEDWPRQRFDRQRVDCMRGRYYFLFCFVVLFSFVNTSRASRLVFDYTGIRLRGIDQEPTSTKRGSTKCRPREIDQEPGSTHMGRPTLFSEKSNYVSSVFIPLSFISFPLFLFYFLFFKAWI